MTLAHVSEIVRRFEADRAAVSYAEWRAWLAAQERRIAIHHIRSKLQAMSTGHRTPYGLAFAPDGRLWEVEHGPRGGDELNLIEPGKNYGWPLVSYATNYNGVPIPSPETRPDLTKPVVYWTPIIGPGNLMFYKGAMFPQWQGSALIGGMQSKTLNRITFDGKGGATAAERWSVGHRIRDVEVAPDGAVWLIEDANPGGLFRVTPKPQQ